MCSVTSLPTSGTSAGPSASSASRGRAFAARSQRIGVGGVMDDDAWWGAGLLVAGEPGAVWARSGPGDAVSFSELRARTGQLARTMACHGVRSGSTVSVHGTPSFTQLWLIFALWSIGAQVILPEPELGWAEREAWLDLSAPQ